MASVLRPLADGRESSLPLPSFRGRPTSQAAVPPFGTNPLSGALHPFTTVPVPAALKSALPSITAALPWLLAFAVGEWVSSYPSIAPIIPHTVLRLMSVPLGLFAVALLLRPAREAAVYAALFIGVSLLREAGTPHLAFSVVRILIEAAEMGFIVWLLYRHFWDRLYDPIGLAAWAITVLAVAAGAAAMMVLAAAGLGLASSDSLPALGGNLTVAWRYWWLANSCTYLTLAGPLATLAVLRQRLWLLLATPGSHRRPGCASAGSGRASGRACAP